MGGESKTSPNWDGQQWSGEDDPNGDTTPRWNKGQWAGEEPVDVAPDQGSDTEPSGDGQNPSGQHWAEKTEK